jgi:peroxiredoxin
VLGQLCGRLAASVQDAGAKYPFPLLCDEDRAVIKRYGVWHPIGIDALNVAHPAAFLIDAKRKVRYSFVGRTQFARAPLAKILAIAAEP